MWHRLCRFAKREAVFCVSLLAAVVSMFFVPPSGEYFSYINWNVLALLWCLMAVVAGFRRCGVFERLTAALLGKFGGNGHLLAVILVLLPFFTAMVVTNDVALLTFVPFTLGLLSTAGCLEKAAPLLVLQTAAANLGCVATPVGDPHNLYLFDYYAMTPGEFFPVVLPLAGLGLLCVSAAAFPVLPKAMPEFRFHHAGKIEKRRFFPLLALFVLCLCTVLRLLPWWILLPIVFAGVLILDKRLLAEPDYILLLTFLCFFVFSGNLGRIAPVRELLRGLMEKNALLTSILASQVISNVPASVLLAPFTSQGMALLVGTDIGAFGTPIASLASLITLKFYLHSEGRKPGKYIAIFLAVNIAVLLITTPVASLLLR